MFLRGFRFTSRFYVAAAMFLLIVLFAWLGPQIFDRYSPADNVGGQYDGPSSKSWLGTDNLNQDVFTNLMHGAQTSLEIGLIAGAASTVIGVIIGVIAGYRGGILEEVLMGFTNIVLAIPAIVVLILISTALETRSVVSLALVIAITSWPWTARAVRAQTSSVRTREHVDVARLSGARTTSILMLDVLPYMFSYIAMSFVLHVSGAVLAEAGLSLLGLGPSNEVSLGQMLHWAITLGAVRVGAWWAFVPPTLLLTVIAFSLMLMQSSLDELFNPRLRRGRMRQKQVPKPAEDVPEQVVSA